MHASSSRRLVRNALGSFDQVIEVRRVFEIGFVEESRSSRRRVPVRWITTALPGFSADLGASAVSGLFQQPASAP
jgi:hypothetical protein